jgi:xylulokinase
LARAYQNVSGSGKCKEASIAVLGIDIGTSGSRAVIVDDEGRVVGSATAEHAAFASPQTAWAEQQPDDWWRAAREAIRASVAASGLGPSSIAAIGLSGQMHGAVLVDSDGQVVRPAIIWCDQRTEPECQWLTDTIGRSRLLALTSNPALTNFTLPKLLWVRAHEPAAWRRVRHVILPKDFVRLRLSGEYAIDVADASGTLMLDVARRQWSREIVDAAGIDREMLPAVFESPEICARVSRDGASATGLVEGTPIVAGAGDQAAGAVGMGITRPGTVSATIGTSGVVFAATDRPALDPAGRLHTFCHAIPDRWHVMGVTQAAGLSLRWLREQFGLTAGGDRAYEEMTSAAASVEPGADGVLWAPYLMGERTPHLDPGIRAAFAGLAASHGRGHLVRAVLEGVAFSLRDSFSIFDELGLPVRKVRLGGGGARSALWRQIQADVYGYDVEVVPADEGAAFGAALLAGVGARMWPSVDEACDRLVRSSVVASPDSRASLLMTERYAAYRRVYPALRAISRGVPSHAAL